MRTIDVYKTRFMKLIDEVKLNKLQIHIYEVKIEGYDETIEYGISISDEKNKVKIPIYKDVTIEDIK